MNKKDTKFDFESYSKNVKLRLKRELLAGILTSYIETNKGIEKFSNWCLAISGSMIPLLLINFDKIHPFYKSLNLKTIIILLLFSSMFGVLTKVYGYIIDSIFPFINYSENKLTDSLNSFDEEFKIVEKSGHNIDLLEQDLSEITKEFFESLNEIAKINVFIKKSLYPKQFKNFDSPLINHKKAAKKTSTRRQLLIVQFLLLIISFLYMIIKIKA